MENKSKEVSAWRQPGLALSWPSKVLPVNLVQRLTGGLRDSYAAVRNAHAGGVVSTTVTAANGQLQLSPSMPLIGRRYRYLHTLWQSELSQVVSATDTYRHCAQTIDGRCTPLVALKIVNAQHWTLGAQEHERMRQLWRQLSAENASPRLARPRGHFEEGAHFCIVFDLLAPLAVLHTPMEVVSSAVQAASPVLISGGIRRPSPLVHGPIARTQPFGLAVKGCGDASRTAELQLGRDSGTLEVADKVWHTGQQVDRLSDAQRPQLSLATIRHVAVQVLGGLASLHAHGILHADLKLDNILVDAIGADGGSFGSDGSCLSCSFWQSRGAKNSCLSARVVLIDFSNAMSLEETVAYHDSYEVQTLAYRAPEVVYGVPFSSGIDMWSLGICLAEMYCGHAFFNAASRSGLAVECAGVLGRPPVGLYSDGKYNAELFPLVAHSNATCSVDEVRLALTELLLLLVVLLLAGGLAGGFACGHRRSTRRCPRRCRCHAFVIPHRFCPHPLCRCFCRCLSLCYGGALEPIRKISETDSHGGALKPHL